jgi:hypothetical protein
MTTHTINIKPHMLGILDGKYGLAAEEFIDAETAASRHVHILMVPKQFINKAILNALDILDSYHGAGIQTCWQCI